MTPEYYNHCVLEYADHIYRFIYKNLRNTHDAEDVVQAAFEKLWVNRHQVDTGKLKSYLFTIAYHQMIDHLRRSRRETSTDHLHETAAGTLEQPQAALRDTLDRALATLNETQRSLVMLKDYEGYSYREIGEIMDLSESQVKVYLHRARILLRNYLVAIENNV